MQTKVGRCLVTVKADGGEPHLISRSSKNSKLHKYFNIFYSLRPVESMAVVM